MNVTVPDQHDPEGLFWYASWLSGHGFFVSLLLCLLLAPIAMIVIAPIGESRFLPLGKKQFNGFFPGTLFLAFGAALLLSTDLPHEARWYNAFWWHFVLQIATLAGTVLVTLGDRKVYAKRALWSPTKIFNNLLYAFFGYVLVAVFTANLFGADWGFWLGVKEIFAWVAIAIWVTLVLRDGKLPKTDPDAFALKVKSAHIADWKPIWRTLREVMQALRD